MWHHQFLSHKQVQGIFGDEPPTLERVWVAELLFKSPSQMHFSAYIECPFSRFPSAWKAKGYDRMQFRFTVALSAPPKLRGIPTSSAEASVRFESNHFSIEALDQSWSVGADASLQMVYAEPFEEPGPGHDHDWFRVYYR